MSSSSLGNRANGRGDRNGAVRRFLAAGAACVVLSFGVGAPLAAAQASATIARHDGGGDSGQGDHGDQALRQLLERLFQRLLAELHEQDHQAVQSPPPTTTPTTTPPVTVPAVPPGPVTTPVPVGVPAVVPIPVGAISGGAVSASSARHATATGDGLAAPAAGGSGTPRALTPPAAAPATTPRASSVARALRTARSYGALLALAAAVVVFLLVQGRVDRRDPRILSALAEDHMTFRDFE